MTRHYNPADLSRMMRTGRDKPAAESEARTPLRDVTDQTPWSRADDAAHEARLTHDRTCHAETLRMLAQPPHERALGLYLGEAMIRGGLRYGGEHLLVIPAWGIAWESGMPQKGLRQFYMRVALAVPGQRDELHGDVLIHFDTKAKVVGGGLPLPALPVDPAQPPGDPTQPPAGSTQACRLLDATLARGLFNVMAAHLQERGLNMHARVREQIAGRLTPEWQEYDRARYPNLEP